MSWGEEALDELETMRERVERRNVGRGLKLIEAIDGLMASLGEFPLQGPPVNSTLTTVLRRVRLRAFGLLLYYTVYPSVDLQTGEVLDVIHFLACRHERQGEPLWEPRDPFRLR